MKMLYRRNDVIRDGLIYSLGDTIAALISDDFSLNRLVGILVIGATIYALEIPNYFRWIDQQIRQENNPRSTVGRSLLAMLYFNPLWIARHILFIRLFMHQTSDGVYLRLD